MEELKAEDQELALKEGRAARFPQELIQAELDKVETDRAKLESEIKAAQEKLKEIYPDEKRKAANQ